MKRFARPVIVRLDAELEAAMRWQQERAWEALERWEAGVSAEVKLDELRRTHQVALRAGRR